VPNKVMVRPDGSTVRVADTDAEKLLTLGYLEQAPEAEMESAISAGQEAHYSSPLQKIMTFQEGGDSGVSLGLTDLIFGNEESRERARYNPGTRIGGEIAGNLAATMIPGTGLLRFTPAGALARGAEVAGETIGAGSKVINSMVRGSVEGAGFGAGQAITSAQLDGSPITAEAILAGMGQGALWGGGLGALGGGLESKLESRALKKLEAETALTKEEMAASETASRAEKEYRAVQGLADNTISQSVKEGKMEAEHFERMVSSIQDASAAIKEIKTAAETVADPKFDKLGGMQNRDYTKLVENGNLHYVRAESRSAIKQFSMAQLAAKEGKFEKMTAHLEKFKEEMVTMQVKLGGPKIYDASKSIEEANNLIGLGKYRVDTASRAAQDMAEMTAVHSTLSAFPKSLDEFQSMTPARLEKLTAGVDALGKINVAELQGIKDAVKEAVSNMGAGMGVTMEGTPGAQLQGLWKVSKEAGSRRVADMMEKGKSGNLLWDKYNKAKDDLGKVRSAADEERKATKGMSAAQRAMYRSAQYGAGSWTAKRLGMGYGGYMLGSSLVAGLVGLKGAILGTLSEKASVYLPKAAKGLQKFGSRVEPLATRLDGMQDQGKKDRVALMETRKRELAEAAPIIRDTMYRAVQPLSIEHPDLAASLHQLGVKRFQFLMSKLPKDPGLAFSNLKSLWKPDKVEVEKFSRYYEAYHDPVGVLTRALDTGKITPEGAEGVREMNPELWTHFRTALLMRVVDPEVMKDVTYQDQVHLGLLTGITFHASMNPQFIASTQQMFLERNKPLEMNPQTQPGGGAGRPAANSPQSTSSQRITEH
jgi:hypothetical protein